MVQAFYHILIEYNNHLNFEEIGSQPGVWSKEISGPVCVEGTLWLIVQENLSLKYPFIYLLVLKIFERGKYLGFVQEAEIYLTNFKYKAY